MILTVIIAQVFWTSQKRSDCGCFPECVWTTCEVDMSQSPFTAEYYWKLVGEHGTSEPEHMVHTDATK